MNTDTRQYAQGTSLTQQFPWGLYVAGRVLCSDGKVRSLKRIAQTADTFYSVPVAVAVKGRTVSGYVTIDDDVAKFVAYTYGKNGALLS